MVQPRRQVWLLCAGGVIVLAALFATAVRVFMPPAWGAGVPWARTFLYNFCHFAIWALLSPLLLVLVRRFPLHDGAWRTAVPVQVVASCAVAVGQLALAELMLAPLLPAADPVRPTLLTAIRFSLAINFQSAVMTYWAISGAAYAYLFHRREVEASRLAGRLQAAAAEERFRTLESHVAPHFLFNALNSVAALVDLDPPRAKTLIARLGDLLRQSLAARELATMSLDDELDVVARYLEIEQARFADRLRVEIDASRQARECQLPAFLLQPLVENAIRHGLQPSTQPVTIAVTARLDAAGLIVVISDDAAVPDRTATSVGLGLTRTRARLEQIYGPRHVFTAGPAGDRGYRVAIEIPALRAQDLKAAS